MHISTKMVEIYRHIQAILYIHARHNTRKDMILSKCISKTDYRVDTLKFKGKKTIIRLSTVLIK